LHTGVLEHALFLQLCAGVAHAAQVWPPLPHALSAVPGMQSPFWQQPNAHEDASHVAPPLEVVLAAELDVVLPLELEVVPAPEVEVLAVELLEADVPPASVPVVVEPPTPLAPAPADAVSR
jgi:hypothetical protein